MAKLEPAEARALLEGAGGAQTERAVEPRDFRRPHRLSHGQRLALENVVTGLLPSASAALSDQTGDPVLLGMQSVGEVDARGLFDGEQEAPCVMAFAVEGNPGWMAWESGMAVATVEHLLGVHGTDGEERELSDLEAGVLVELLAPLVRRVASALDAQATGFALVQSREALQRAAAAAAESDGHRLELELSIERAGRSGTLRCYLPGLRPSPGRASANGVEPKLQAAVRAVPLTLHARLVGCEVPLSQLLALEVGDVIPLEDRLDAPVVLEVEGEHYATARLGTRRGKLAVRIERIHKENP